MSASSHNALGVSPSAGFHVQYEVKEVNSEMGLGLFATEDIPMGTLIWEYSRDERPLTLGETSLAAGVTGVTVGNVRCYDSYEATKERLHQLSPQDQKFFMDHVYAYSGLLNEILDDGKYWNHSEEPNTGCGPDPNSSYALKDIKAGDQLLDDYGTYEFPDWFIDLAREYNIPQDFFRIKPRPGFQIEYEIKNSPGRGCGIYTKEFIPQNTLIWKFQKGANVRLFKGEEAVRFHLAAMSKDERIDWLTHVYMFDGYINEILDDGKMWNHSEMPNTYSGYLGDWDSTYAKRNIEIGEELLDDYGAYEYSEWFLKLCMEYGVPQDFFVVKASGLPGK